MLRRLTYITGTLAAILLAVLLFGSLTEQAKDDRLTLDRDQLPGGFDPDVADKPLGPEKGRSREAHIQRTDAEGRLIQEYFFATLDPRQEGEFDATFPKARFYLAPHRVIEMRSDTGYFVAPGDRPRRGRFSGNLLIRIYETSPGKVPNLSADSPDIVLSALLDEANFDITLGKIESIGPVRVVTPDTSEHAVEFSGRGLVVVYNEPEQRIDYLRIRHGDHLKYRTAQASAKPDAAGPATPAGAKPPDAAPAQVQYYRVTFADDVKVVSEDQTLTADTMEALFAFNRGNPRDAAPVKTTRRRTAPASFGGASILTVASTEDIHPLLRNKTSPAKSDARKQAKEKPTEVTLTWSGEMIMKPQEGRPEPLIDERDVMLRFTGRPVVASDGRQQTLTCGMLGYREAAQVLTAKATTGYPVRIEAEAMGDVSAAALQLDMAKRTGELRGPGSLRSTSDPKVRGARPGFGVRWADRMTLAYSERDGQAQIDQACFFGGVQVDDAEFDFNAEQLTTHFAHHAKHRTQLAGIEAEGKVRVKAERGHIAADQLKLTTKADAQGRLRPYLLQTTGNVALADPAQSISAGKLIVTLADQSTGSAASTRDKGKTDRLKFDSRVRHIWAEDEVKLTLDSGKTRIVADTLDADADKRTAALVGSPVTLRRGDSQLKALALNVAEDGRVAHGRGGGEFHYLEGDAQDEPGQRVDVTWSGEMTYSDALNRITITGDVKARSSDKPTEQNSLTADQVTLELIDEKVAEQLADKRPSSKSETPGHRVLKQITATGEAVLLATRYKDATRKRIDTRLRLNGPILSFNNVTEHAQIKGPGKLLVEDYRPVSPDKAKAKSQVNISGRGATLFTWTGGMDMSGAEKAFSIHRGVRMTHQSTDKKQGLVELQCGKLFVAMSGLGGMRAVRMTENEKVDIDAFTAEQSVQLRDPKRLISCHQLRYEAARRTVRLSALPGRQVEIAQLDQPKPLRARSILWHLDKDRVEVLRAGY